MNNVLRDDLLKLARRLSDITENVRRVHNESGLQPNLASALTDLVRAEALILETATT